MATLTGHTGPVPYLACEDAAAAIAFYIEAFGAEEVLRLPAPENKIGHAELRIFDGRLYLSDREGGPALVHAFVADVDAAFERAIESGATVVEPVEDRFWGDREGILRDPFGHEWGLATHLRDMTVEEVARIVEDL
jgi:PhnB protein